MYLAIDIETTGLNPETDQVLEIGAVLDLQCQPIMECPSFRTVLKYDRLSGDPFALAMNADVIRESIDFGTPVDRAMQQFNFWLDEYLGPNIKPHLLGKNVGSFDVQFLKRLPGFPIHRFSYRHLEVGSLFATPNGVESLSDLLRYTQSVCKFPGKEHTALFDARIALAVCRNKWEVAV